MEDIVAGIKEPSKTTLILKNSNKSVTRKKFPNLDNKPINNENRGYSLYLEFSTDPSINSFQSNNPILIESL